MLAVDAAPPSLIVGGRAGRLQKRGAKEYRIEYPHRVGAEMSAVLSVSANTARVIPRITSTSSFAYFARIAADSA